MKKEVSFILVLLGVFFYGLLVSSGAFAFEIELRKEENPSMSKEVCKMRVYSVPINNNYPEGIVVLISYYGQVPPLPDHPAFREAKSLVQSLKVTPGENWVGKGEKIYALSERSAATFRVYGEKVDTNIVINWLKANGYETISQEVFNEGHVSVKLESWPAQHQFININLRVDEKSKNKLLNIALKTFIEGALRLEASE